MRSRLITVFLPGTLALLLVAAAAVSDNGKLQSTVQFRNSSGISQTLTTAGFIDPNNAFFQVLGTNGRSCATCHQAQDGWTVTPEHLKQRFIASGGTDPVFRPNDGATCPTDDVSTLSAKKKAYRLLLSKGLIRIDRPLPTNAEFTIQSIDDPYGCSSSEDISVYRRPLPATNLTFLSTVMWDGRETNPNQSLNENLKTQALDATTGHAQGQPPSSAQLQSIVDFESALYTAQIYDNRAGRLNSDGAMGGAMNLAKQEFFIGINDPLGQNPIGAAFDPEVFTLYKQWADASPENGEDSVRASIARGEQIFNLRPIAITGVGGLNDALHQPVIQGTCTTCHDSPNVGHHSVVAPLNLGLTDAAQRTPDLPLFTLKCTATGEIFKTTDPGRAMVSGKCADIGKFKGPILRGLASRAPYFHNGAAANLEQAVDFYDTRFNLELTKQEKADLVAFLRSL